MVKEEIGKFANEESNEKEKDNGEEAVASFEAHEFIITYWFSVHCSPFIVHCVHIRLRNLIASDRLRTECACLGTVPFTCSEALLEVAPRAFLPAQAGLLGTVPVPIKVRNQPGVFPEKGAEIC